MEKIFRCPGCGTALEGWQPSGCVSCGYTIQQCDGVLIFTSDPNLNLNGSGNSYIGYDTIAERYDRTRHREKQIRETVGRVIAEIIGSGKVLADVGAGTGPLAVEVARAGCRVIACDISVNMLKILATKQNTLSERAVIPCRCNAYRLPLLDGAVDAAMTSAFLHLVESPERIIEEIRRILKPGGIYVTPYYDREGPEDGINQKIVHYYYQLIEEKGVALTQRYGWGKEEKIATLHNIFRSHRYVEGDELTFRFPSTPAWEMEKIGDRANSDQVGLAEDVHNRIMAEVRQRLVSEYGEEFETIEQEQTVRISLGVYSV